MNGLGLRAPLRAIDVCAGSGIGSAAFEVCGFANTVLYIERDPWCQRLLQERMRTGDLLPAPIWDDLKTFDGRPWCGRVDIIFGGIPCQPYSVAGKQLGDADERDLWPDLRRIVREVQPRLVLIENVSGFLVHGGGLQRVLGELAADGCDAEWATVAAADLGANHLRKRVWIVAYHADAADLRGAAIKRHEQDGYVPGDVAYPGAGRRPGDELRAGWQEPGGDSAPLALTDGWGRDGQPQQQGQGPAGRGRAGKGGDDVADAARGGQRTDWRAPGSAGHVDKRGADVADAEGQPERAGLCAGGQAEQRRGRPGDGGGAGDAADADNTATARQRQHCRGLHAEPKPEGPRECSGDAGRLAESGLGSLADGLAAALDGSACYEWWQHEPDVPRIATGVRDRVAQLKCLGNGWVPAVTAYVAGRIQAGLLAETDEVTL